MTNFVNAPDIEETILSALATLFQQELITKVAQADPLLLKTLRAMPLQDDPINSAPYVIYGPDPEKGYRLMHREEEEIYGCAEIGGGVRFIRFYQAQAGVPMYPTREAAYAAVNNLTTRVVGTLMSHFDLAGILEVGPLVSGDLSHIIEGANYRLVDLVTTKLEGGEQSWFGMGVVTWHYPVTWYEPPFFSFTGALGS